jgi:acetyl-CoA synthetase
MRIPEMIANLVTTNETVETLSDSTEEYAAPAVVAENALLKDAATEYERWRANPDTFWEQEAEKFIWLNKWDQVSAFDGINHSWFSGGKTNITLNALDRHANSEKGEKNAFIWLAENGRERKITYRELHSQVGKFANGLKALGVKKGETVTIYMPLTIEGVISMLACARIGAIHSVVYAGLGKAALRDRITDAKSKWLICGDIGFRRGKIIDLKSIVDEAVAPLNFIEKAIVFRRGDVELKETEVDFAELFNFNDECQAEPMGAEDPLFIIYTSGTTGKPKGVVHVHGGYMVGTTYHLRSFFDVGDQDVFWCTSDIGWIVGHSYIVYAPLCAGATTLFREGAIDFPHQGIAWEIVEKYRVTKMFTAPTALRFFMRFGAELPAKYDISSLRVLACAGEPLNPEAWRWAQTYLCGDGSHGYCVDNWWQTELGAPAIATPVTMPMRPGKAGVPLAGVEADVVDADGNICPPNVGGRLVLRRPFPSMMKTVWGDQQRYERMWKQIEGSYVSGDVAVKDADGYLMILGRADDVINIAGHRIGTADVESALVSHQSVAEAAVIGLPDEIKGESIKAFIQLRNGQIESAALAAELIAHVRDELGAIIILSQVDFVKTLPKTRSGKIMRRYLKALELGTDVGDLSTLEE